MRYDPDAQSGVDMNLGAILKAIHEGEPDSVEFKRDADLKKIGKAISAFANSDGGILILGVSDDGKVVGIQDNSESLTERITSFLQNGLSAPVQARLGREVLPEGRIHWIEVPRQRGFEPLRYAGNVYVRRARSSVEPGPSELAELYNMFGYIVTEERTVAGVGLDELDLPSFQRYLKRLGLDLEAEPQIAIENDLISRGVLAELGESACATIYGLLAFGKSPQAYSQTQNFFVQCVSYAGKDRAAEVIEVLDAKGQLDEQVRKTLGWLTAQPRREVYRGIERIDIPLLPPKAAREVVVNAVAHRDYAIIGSKILVERFSDRVEFTSPGRLTNGLTPDSVRRGGNPRARNQSITNFLLASGLMEQRGRGWPIIEAALREQGLAAPILEEDREARWVRVTMSTVV
jgi:ATP-dependent DNA helicase RecG